MQPDPLQAPPRTALPWLVAAGLWLAMTAVVVLTLWHLRDEAVNGQARELRLLSLAATDAVERGLRGAEEGLHALRAEVEEAHLQLGDDGLGRSLRTRAALMPLVQAVWLLDSQGRVLAGSSDEPPPEAAGFLPPLAALPRDGLAVSRSYRRPAAGANASAELVAVAVPFSAPQGRQGWVLSTLPSAELLGALGGALPSADTRMLVVRHDGVRLAAVNAADVSDAEVAAAIRRDAGSGRAPPTPASDRDTLLQVQGVPRYGVHVLVSRDAAAALGAWRQAAELAAVALLVMLVVKASAVVLVQRAERRRAQAQAALQAQLSRAGKLESLGTLAGGVAHDFNNVLAAIVGFGEMAQDAAVPDSAQARHLDKVMQAALRGKLLVERILTFSRSGAKTSTVFELEPLVEEVLSLLSGSLRSGIVLQRQFEAPGARLKGDATQAVEAVMNLCTNAMQAMPQGGVLSVRLARVVVGAARVLSHSQLPPGRWLALTVADHGSGISPSVMEHLFEPFFTTKSAQSGTGLGLAVVFGVVAEFGGAIDVQSPSGQGALFTLYLPECQAGAEDRPAEPWPDQRGQGQRVMVVDDEPELAALTVEMLQGLGYRATGFADPLLALQALKDNGPAWVDAVLTDEVMPGLTGTQFTQAVHQRAPGLPVVLLTGYGGALLAQRATAAGVSRVLAKPVQRAELARVLAEVLRTR